MVAENVEASRLEGLWSGRFGDDYAQRNADAGTGRAEFWDDLMGWYPVASVLEVGCNVGANVGHLRSHLAPRNIWGVDVGEEALRQLRTRYPDVNSAWARARDLPFRDARFDLVMTVGVLIHQPSSTLPLVMAEVVRCSSRFILCAEYESAQEEEVPYREQHGALFRRPYGQTFLELFPELERIDGGFLSRQTSGFDDTTWHLFRKHDPRMQDN